jgi:hypothetical protein
VDTRKVDGMCAHASKDTYNVEYCANLIDNVELVMLVQVIFKMLWKRLGKLIKSLGRLVEL